MEEKEILILLHKSWTEQLSDQEERELRSWLAASDQNRELASRMSAAWEASHQKSEAPKVDIEKAWDKFSRRIHEPAVKVQKPRRRFIRLAVAAAVLLIMSFFFWFQYDQNKTWKTVENNLAQLKTVDLPDGSTVVLNQFSSIEYKTAFTNSRSIKLKGEAWFDVEKDPEHPFSVTTHTFDIEVLGTAFNVRAFPEDKIQEVYVSEGEVQVITSSVDSVYMLKANDKLVLDKSGPSIRKSSDNTGNAVAWRTKKLSFRNTPLKKVIADIERCYNISIQLENKELMTCRFTSPFVSKEATQVLQTLCTAFNMSMKQTGEGSYILEGGSCK